VRSRHGIERIGAAPLHSPASILQIYMAHGPHDVNVTRTSWSSLPAPARGSTPRFGRQSSSSRTRDVTTRRWPPQYLQRSNNRNNGSQINIHVKMYAVGPSAPTCLGFLCGHTAGGTAGSSPASGRRTGTRSRRRQGCARVRAGSVDLGRRRGAMKARAWDQVTRATPASGPCGAGGVGYHMKNSASSMEQRLSPG
jgi:hypothetical protein